MSDEDIIPIIPAPFPGDLVAEAEAAKEKKKRTPIRVPAAFSGLLPSPAGHGLTFRIAAGFLALISLVAFWSLSSQIQGLIGPGGMAPVELTMQALGQHMENSTVPKSLRWPTVFWFKDAPWMITGVLVAGIVFSITMLTGALFLWLDSMIWPSALMLIACYLSLINGAGDFMMFQWDILLVECLFVILFMFPVMGSRDEFRPGMTGMWMWRVLLFKLLLCSALVKLSSGDASWWNLTALATHFETQPLPMGTAWFMHHLPAWMLRIGALHMFAVELLLPLLIFCGRWPRFIAAFGIVLLQILIIATGNFTFFNFLTIVLAIGLLDDRLLGNSELPPAALPAPRPVRLPAWLLGGLWIGLSMFHVLAAAAPGREGIVNVVEAARPVSPWRINNPYGLFSVMTPTRPEILIEGSEDGNTWKPYRFKYKPGPFDQRPNGIAPHQPRLDWQMWFFALQWQHQVAAGQAPGRPPWVTRMTAALFKNEESVVALFGANPFADQPPSFIRMRCLVYEYTTPEEREQTGNWWKATPLAGPTMVLRKP